MNRSSGILLHISSLPSKYGIGCFSEAAYNFADWLNDAGQSYWQILPLGPTSYGDSPYQSFSSFAGNPYFINLEEFIDIGYLTKEECNEINFGENISSIDYGSLYKNRYTLLNKAYKRSDISKDSKFQSFVNQNSYWLDDYALFMAVKNKFNGSPWTEWNKDIKLRTSEAIERYSYELSEEIEFQKFMQFHFYLQWNKLKTYVNSKGIKIIGDIPIYVAFDSTDAWANPQLFQFDENNTPIAVAGCPPDGFSATGQLWGNPLYKWDYHKKTDYKWWISRLSHCFNLYDVLRIDHFRGFDEYYSIPYGADNAINGHWEKGPGMDIFKAIKKVLGEKDYIAEDLGYMTDSVRQLVKESGFPGMKVLEFAFDSRDTGCRNDYLPHNYSENCIAYTGTHDNQTITSWFDTISEEEQNLAREYLCDYNTPTSELYTSFICLIMRSNAKLCIIPMQDYLGYDDSCRMNEPSTLGKNWKWRLKNEDLSDSLKQTIYRIAELYGRLK